LRPNNCIRQVLKYRRPSGKIQAPKALYLYLVGSFEYPLVCRLRPEGVVGWNEDICFDPLIERYSHKLSTQHVSVVAVGSKEGTK
jgi:hypothetical protein